MNNLYPKITIAKLKSFNISVIIVAVLLLAASNVNAQQTLINYAQFSENLTVYNPAYSLLDKAGSVSTVLSRQFVEIQDGAPTALVMNLNLPFENINAAGGLVVKNN